MNILFYLNKTALSDPDDSTTYVYNEAKKHFNTELCFDDDLSRARDADVIFHRIDIPWSEQFLRELHQEYNDGSKLFINDPLSKINFQSKKYLLNFPHLTPTTIVSKDVKEIMNFVYQQGHVVIKPDGENKGTGVKQLHATQYNPNELQDFVTNYLHTYEQAVVQDYIKNVEKLGDKRVNVVNYEPVSAILRLPPEGSFICNLSAGGSAHQTEVTDHDKYIVSQLAPYFRKHNLPWVGVDIIGPYLGEFNTSSPGNLIEADTANKNTFGRDAVMNMLDEYHKQL